MAFYLKNGTSFTIKGTLSIGHSLNMACPIHSHGNLFYFFNLFGQVCIIFNNLLVPLNVLNISTDEFDHHFPKCESFLMRLGLPASLYCL